MSAARSPGSPCAGALPTTHPALNGVGYHEDRFGEGGISKSLFYVARLWQREDWVAPAPPKLPD